MKKGEGRRAEGGVWGGSCEWVLRVSRGRREAGKREKKLAATGCDWAKSGSAGHMRKIRFRSQSKASGAVGPRGNVRSLDWSEKLGQPRSLFSAWTDYSIFIEKLLKKQPPGPSRDCTPLQFKE